MAAGVGVVLRPAATQCDPHTHTHEVRCQQVEPEKEEAQDYNRKWPRPFLRNLPRRGGVSRY
eukprot:797444-Rhodomonas_salina.2